MADDMTVTALWWAVIFSGVYHGVNPGMGWPLAVSAALMTRKPSALAGALGLLATGHFLSMLAILLPFSIMIFLIDWEAYIRGAAGALVAGMGLYLLINPRHPRYLARVHPARLALWSFLAAIAHGAGLMLVPIYLGICAINEQDAGHVAAGGLMSGDLGTAFWVARSSPGFPCADRRFRSSEALPEAAPSMNSAASSRRRISARSLGRRTF